jgi:hypothetical protein
MENAYKALDCAGYARIDCFYQDANQSPTNKPRVVILEFNTLPGMTPATCIFHQAAEYGMKPMDFIDKIINLGFENHIEKTKIKQINESPKHEPALQFEEFKEVIHQEKSHKKSKAPKSASFDTLNDENDSVELKMPEDDFTMKLF